MKANRIIAAIVAVFLSVSAATAQKTEITISLNEQFFDALLDAIYQNSPPPEFQLSSLAPSKNYAFMRDPSSAGFQAGFTPKGVTLTGAACGSVTLLRENK